MENITFNEMTDPITGEVFTTATIKNEDGGFTSMPKSVLLAKLGITAEEAKLLLS